MSSRPYVLLSVASSLDGRIDDTSPARLVLSNEDDFDRVDRERAGVDAILVGAGTIRADNPRLLVRSAERRQARLARGEPESPVKVTFSSDGKLDPSANFFTTGDTGKLVYTPNPEAARAQLGAVATVVGAGDPFDLHLVLADLAARGITRLMVEGGGHVHTQFLAADVVDELQLVFAPFFVGEADAPGFVHPAALPQSPRRPMRLAAAEPIGDVVLLRYLVKD